MAFTAVYRTTVKYKTLSGEIDTIQAVSEVSAAAALAVAQAALQLKSGQSIVSVSNSVSVDPTTFTLGHSDASEEAVFIYKVSGQGGDKTETLDEVSLAYKNASLNDGTIDITNSNITDYFNARGTATGQTLVVVRGHYG